MKDIQKILVAVFVPLGVFGVGYWMWKQSNATKIDTSGAKISDEQARIYADQLYQAFMDFGSDESTVRGIFSKLSGPDFRLVYSKYGVKPYLWFGSAPDWLGYPYDLVQWMKVEIGTKYVNVNNVIKEAGFEY